MTGAASVLVCALEVLGRSAAGFPPIELVASPPPGASARAEAFVRTGHPIIYVVTSTNAFRDARCGDRRSLLKLASILAHEEWHVQNGPDERGAYSEQLRTLWALGVKVDSPTYVGVVRAMEFVLASKAPASPSAALVQPPPEQAPLVLAIPYPASHEDAPHTWPHHNRADTPRQPDRQDPRRAFDAYDPHADRLTHMPLDDPRQW